MIKSIIDWLKDNWAWMFVISAITVIVSVAIGLILIISLPPDYFTRSQRISRIRNPIFRIFLFILKNLFGVIALILGFVMLFTPGQGILTLLVGVILCDFPGKRKLERKLIQQNVLRAMVNRIRKRYNRPPIVVDDS